MAAKRKVKRQAHSTGGEPVWTSKLLPTRIDIVKALNWYNVERDEKAAAKILKTTPAIAKPFQTVAWVKRMFANGFTLPVNESASYIEKTLQLKEAIKSQRGDSGDASETVNIQKRTLAKTDQIIGEMQGLIDEFGIHGDAKKTNAYQWMVDNNVKPVHANRIAEFFRKESVEVLKAAEGKDADLAEGYAMYGRKRLLNLLQCHANIIKDALRLSEQTKTARKPRKKKPVSFEKRVSKIKYQVRDDALKLQSLDPVRILGAQQLWIYNTKTRKLGVYNAQDESGLDVKGSSLKNFAVSTSISKTLRKPNKSLPLVVDGGKIALRKVMDGINAKEIKLTGRINKDTLLLRVS